MNLPCSSSFGARERPVRSSPPIKRFHLQFSVVDYICTFRCLQDFGNMDGVARCAVAGVPLAAPRRLRGADLRHVRVQRPPAAAAPRAAARPPRPPRRGGRSRRQQRRNGN